MSRPANPQSTLWPLLPALIVLALVALLPAPTAVAQTDDEAEALPSAEELLNQAPDEEPEQTDPATTTQADTQPTTAPADDVQSGPKIPQGGLARLSYGITHLPMYFGPLGISAVALWVLAVLTLIVFCRSRRRTIAYLIALGLAILAMVLSEFSSDRVSEFVPDQTALQAEGIARQEAARQREEAAASQPTAKEQMFSDIKIVDAEQLEKEAAATDDSETPAYKLQGKEQREAGSIRTDAVTEQLTEQAGPLEAETESEYRTMPEEDVYLANRMDVLNLSAAEYVLWTCLLMIALDYMLRFNSTFRPLLPVPIGGRTVDSIFRKSRLVRVKADVADAMPAIRSFLSNTLRKRENFICFAPTDAAIHTPCSRLPGGIMAVDRQDISAETEDFDSEFAFETAWFGRCCIVYRGSDGSSAMLDEFIDDLRRRVASKARAFRTLNLVWALPDAIPAAKLSELIALCREANCRLVYVGDPQADVTFDEQYTLDAKAQPVRQSR
ncbi:MAG: hypothetical protein ACLFVU_03425 [Phycisphaerae bacterium]